MVGAGRLRRNPTPSLFPGGKQAGSKVTAGNWGRRCQGQERERGSAEARSPGVEVGSGVKGLGQHQDGQAGHQPPGDLEEEAALSLALSRALDEKLSSDWGSLRTGLCLPSDWGSLKYGAEVY